MNVCNFTTAEGIAIQTVQLNKWKKVLKPEVFEKLKAFAVKNNDNARNGFDITRGDDLNNFIVNYSYNE